MASRKLILFDGRKITIYRQSQFILLIFTVGKAPLQVDNSIKRPRNASLQGCFGKKQREQKPLQGGFAPKQGGFASLQGRFRIKSGEQKLLSG